VGVSAIVVAFGLALWNLAALVVERDPSVVAGHRLELLGWLAVFGLGAIYGLCLVPKDDEPEQRSGAIRVGIVQPNIAPGAARNEDSAIAAVREQIASTRALRKEGVEAVFWGETAVAVAVPASRIEELYPRLFTRELGIPAVIGAATASSRSGWFYNSAVVLDELGTVVGIHVKRYLVPFSESLPGRRLLPWIDGLFPSAREIQGGEDAVPQSFLGHRLSIFICMELLLPDVVRRTISRDRSELIVALANDAWFGDTWGTWMDFASGRLRAVENRRYLVRATGSGISAVVDPWGIARSMSLPLSRVALMGLVAWRSGTTPYQRTGELPWWGAAAVAAWISWKPRRRSADEPGRTRDGRAGG
jgi:apolipoprotein N-acyltransferase